MRRSCAPRVQPASEEQHNRPCHRRAAPEPEQAQQRHRQQQPVAFVAPLRAERVALRGLEAGFDPALERAECRSHRRSHARCRAEAARAGGLPAAIASIATPLRPAALRIAAASHRRDRRRRPGSCRRPAPLPANCDANATRAAAFLPSTGIRPGASAARNGSITAAIVGQRHHQVRGAGIGDQARPRTGARGEQIADLLLGAFQTRWRDVGSDPSSNATRARSSAAPCPRRRAAARAARSGPTGR